MIKMNIELTEKQALIIMVALDKYKNTVLISQRIEHLDLIIDEIKTALLESV